MKIELSAEEARVIGALLEKEIATPDQYPLSLNALTNACNQKSNRDPVMHLDERTVQGLLDRLSNRGLVVDKTGFGSRVPKWRHLFCNTEFGELRFSPGEVAVICELLLRGAQTPGELRSHASRLHALCGSSGRPAGAKHATCTSSPASRRRPPGRYPPARPRRVGRIPSTATG